MAVVTKLEQCILEILRSIECPAPNICATELFCEGWLMRLTLAAWKRGIDCLPFPPAPGSRWFDGARLYSAFLAEERGDVLAETHSKADAVVGQFEFGSTKTGLGFLVLAPEQQINKRIFQELWTGSISAKLSSSEFPRTRPEKSRKTGGNGWMNGFVPYLEQSSLTASAGRTSLRKCIQRMQLLARSYRSFIESASGTTVQIGVQQCQDNLSP